MHLLRKNVIYDHVCLLHRCFCSDERGSRIFGQMWRDDADEMTCGKIAVRYLLCQPGGFPFKDSKDLKCTPV